MSQPLDKDTLRAIMDRHGLTQGQVARALGVDPSLVTRWLQGARRVHATEGALLRGLGRLREEAQAWLTGAALRDWRRAHDLTTTGAAALLGRAQRTWCAWEEGAGSGVRAADLEAISARLRVGDLSGAHALGAMAQRVRRRDDVLLGVGLRTDLRTDLRAEECGDGA